MIGRKAEGRRRNQWSRYKRRKGHRGTCVAECTPCAGQSILMPSSQIVSGNGIYFFLKIPGNSTGEKNGYLLVTVVL